MRRELKKLKLETHRVLTKKDYKYINTLLLKIDKIAENIKEEELSNNEKSHYFTFYLLNKDIRQLKNLLTQKRN